MATRILLYRRGLKSITWHFCQNCSFWPRIDFEQRQAVPVEGSLCGECKVKRAHNSCEPASVPGPAPSHTD